MPRWIDAVKTPDDISVEVLSMILSEEVVQYSLSPLGRGVLSNVQTLEVTLSTRTIKLIAKFRREDIPLEDLFSIEGAFYHLVDELEDFNAFPFQLTKALATGTYWLLLEFISNVTTLDVHQSCPMNEFDDLIYRLAKMHDYCWMDSSNSTKIAKTLNKYSNQLANAPGAGQSLPTSTRKEQFEAAWPDVKKRLVPFFSSESMHWLDDIVEWIAAAERIDMIQASVESKRYTLVHGDFHMGNMLLPKGIEGEKERPWLVDWSFCGIGNPSVDLVFFLAMNDLKAEDTSRVLQDYYSVVRERSQLSWDDFLAMFRQSLLNQFIILVCYDSLCRTMADSSIDEMVEVQHAHFDRVNARCARMILLYNFDDGGILQK